MGSDVKKLDDMFSRVDTIPASRTDSQTDGQLVTAQFTICIESCRINHVFVISRIFPQLL